MRSSSSPNMCERHSAGKREAWWLWEPFNINDAKRIKNNSLSIHRQLWGDVKPGSGLLICFEFYSPAWSMIMSWHFFVLGQQGLACSALWFCFHVWFRLHVCVWKFMRFSFMMKTLLRAASNQSIWSQNDFPQTLKVLSEGCYWLFQPFPGLQRVIWKRLFQKWKDDNAN